MKLKPYTTLFKIENAYAMARASQAVYKDAPDGSNSIDKEVMLTELQKDDEGYKDASVYNQKSTQGAVILHEDYIVVSFRGTDEPADWLDNLNAISVDFAFGEVHRGFHAALMDVWPQMKTQIKRYRWDSKKDLPLWITGHSLGGALATLAAATLIDADETWYGGYTFGAPRVGDQQFSRTFNTEAKNKFYRFQNCSDLVTRIPARIMGYSHQGEFRYLDDEGRLHKDVGFWYRFVDTTAAVLSDIGKKGLSGIKDHAIDKYIEGIVKNAGS